MKTNKTKTDVRNEDTELQYTLDVHNWERHSVNCYFCGELADERNCVPADNFNGNDGGDICPVCWKNNHAITHNNREENPD